MSLSLTGILSIAPVLVFGVGWDAFHALPDWMRSPHPEEGSADSCITILCFEGEDGGMVHVTIGELPEEEEIRVYRRRFEGYMAGRPSYESMYQKYASGLPFRAIVFAVNLGSYEGAEIIALHASAASAPYEAPRVMFREILWGGVCINVLVYTSLIGLGLIGVPYLRARRRRRRGLCPACGYDFRGHDDGDVNLRVCPECGTQFWGWGEAMVTLGADEE